MSKINDLTQGSISKGLWGMAIPLITASFVQMAYNMTDMIWLGRLGSEHVAAVGVAGFFTWLCNALAYITKVGSEVTISQSIGGKHKNRARIYANHATALSIMIALCYALFIWFAARWLTGFFNLDHAISSMSVNYLRIITPGIFFMFNINTFSGLYNGQGDSKTPFKIVATGLVCNIILDPLLIYGGGFIPGLGVKGAAIATLFSQGVVFSIFIYKLYIKTSPIGKLHLFPRIKGRFILRIASLGLPASMQSALFSMFSLTLGTIAARWGHVGVAVQSIGAQIEAITWMTAAGFSTALAAFVGQNYGAGNLSRIRKGYFYTLKLAGGISLLASILFLLFSREIFGIFVQDTETILAGSTYLKILALSQVFSALESVTTGAFNGSGRTAPPAISGIILTGARIPLAYYLITLPVLGLNGIWWSITISSILKGVVLAAWYYRFQQNLQYGIHRPTPFIGKIHLFATRLWQHHTND